MMKPLCIYHHPCADGFTAAWALRRKFPDADFFPGEYGKEIGLGAIAGRHVIMVDYTVKKPVLEQWNKAAASVLVLDHHKTAEADLSGYLQAPPLDHWRNAAWGDVPMPPGSRVAVQFDMARSGAQMAWDYFNGGARPALVEYVADRDLWKFAMEQSRLINAFIFSFNYSFPQWDALERQLGNGSGINSAASQGAAIERKHHKDVAELLTKTQRTMLIGGIEMPVANMPYTMASDAGNIMARQSAMKCAATYYDEPGRRMFSLRSVAGGPDVSAIAVKYGGGGYNAAAGFPAKPGWEGDLSV